LQRFGEAKLTKLVAAPAISAPFSIPAFGICVAFCLVCRKTGDSSNVLKSADSKPHFYVGLTSDVLARLVDHNAGRCPHTARHRPCQLNVIIEFADEERAIEFERYLKAGSGRAFAKRKWEPDCCSSEYEQQRLTPDEHCTTTIIESTRVRG
jgi:putative endonuclease